MDVRWLKRLRERVMMRRETPSVNPSVVPSSKSLTPTVPQPRPLVEPRPDLVAGNFYSFDFFIELKINDVVHLGYPKVCIRDMMTGELRWGSRADWAFPDPAKLRAAWTDDEQRGFTKTTIAKPDDAIGAEGRIGDMHLRFEKILELGRNQIVYALYCPEKNIRLAYGFGRTIFEPTYKRSIGSNSAEK